MNWLVQTEIVMIRLTRIFNKTFKFNQVYLSNFIWLTIIIDFGNFTYILFSGKSQTCCEAGTESHGFHRDSRVAKQKP
jgi:hypothetical protein